MSRLIARLVVARGRRRLKRHLMEAGFRREQFRAQLGVEFDPRAFGGR